MRSVGISSLINLEIQKTLKKHGKRRAPSQGKKQTCEFACCSSQSISQKYVQVDITSK